jgi:hypothetical protein
MATLKGGLANDVSILLAIGRHLGSRPRANTSITIMRPPQRAQGQGSTRGVSLAISGCSCGSAAGGVTLRSARGLSRCSVAFSRSGDPANGDFSDATVIRKFGDVPDDLSAL